MNFFKSIVDKIHEAHAKLLQEQLEDELTALLGYIPTQEELASKLKHQVYEGHPEKGGKFLYDGILLFEYLPPRFVISNTLPKE